MVQIVILLRYVYAKDRSSLNTIPDSLSFDCNWPATGSSTMSVDYHYNYSSKAAKYFQDLKEAKLTLDVLVPLFKAMGFSKVEYHGGPFEKGRDLIMWREDELGDDELIVVQVKRWKTSSSSSSERSFSEVVNQLQQASEESVEHIDGKRHFPSSVYFVTPYEVDARSLSTRFEKYSELSRRRVKIIDGIKLASLVEKHLPKLASMVSGVTHAVHSVTKNKLNNLTLLNALEYGKEKKISKIYTDIDITFGDITTNVFMNAEFDILPPPQKIFVSDWEEFRVICIEITEKYHHNLTTKAIETIDREFDAFKHKRMNFSDALPSRRFGIDINVASIRRFIQRQRNWMRHQAELLNDVDVDTTQLRSILIQSNDFLKFINLLTKHEGLSRVFNLESIDVAGTGHDPVVRITLPIERIIDTGLSVAILGDAGAGKTTCLQMQAKNNLMRGGNRTVLFLPLSQVLFEQGSALENIKESQLLNSITAVIVDFFRREGVDISTSEFEKLLSESDSLLLFDGIDEVVAKFPWIIKSIHQIGGAYPRAQIVISSRVGGKYLSQIDYLGLGLLPFTRDQRNSFIANWFDSPNDPKVEEIISHVDKYKILNEVVKKPLLATIMCVLAEHDIPLPKNELHLYNERMKLLTGYYDIHKKVKRMKSTQDMLVSVARAIAFRLHVEQKRDDVIDLITQKAVEGLAPQDATTERVSLAVQELIYPCNILVPTNYGDKYGFGLLRYQEYLVAQELHMNRSIPFAKYLHSVWWKDVFLMFSQMINDPRYIIDKIFESGNVTDAQETLKALISVCDEDMRNEYERKMFEAISRERFIRQSSSSR